MIQSHRCNCTDATCANDEEHFFVSIEERDYIRPASYHQESLNLSACSIEASSLVTCNKASELVMHVDSGSNVCLVATADVLHNVVSRVGEVTGTGEIKAKVTACGDLILLFALESRTFKVATTR